MTASLAAYAALLLGLLGPIGHVLSLPSLAGLLAALTVPGITGHGQVSCVLVLPGDWAEVTGGQAP